MSDTKDDAAQDICRDFLKGRCTRATCKFKHDASMRDSQLAESPICKDYQSSQCYREKCKYLHLTKDEEEQFKSTGVMPEKKAVEQTAGREVCRDFKNGFCRRGEGCKFSHQSDVNSTLSSLLGKRPPSDVSDFLYGKRPNNVANNFLLGNNSPLQQENERLKKEVLELRKQVLQLQQQNDDLLHKQSSNNSTVMNDLQVTNKPSMYANVEKEWYSY